MDAYHGVASTQKASRLKREKTVFSVAHASSIKACVKTANEKFPHIDWEELGKEAAGIEALKEVKAKKANEAAETAMDGIVGTLK